MRAELPQNRLAKWGLIGSFFAIAGFQLLQIGIVIPISGFPQAGTVMVSQMFLIPVMIGCLGFPALGKKRAFALAALTLLVPFVFGAICGQAIGATVMAAITLVLVPVSIALRSADGR
jgi:hypothetical protein